MLAFARSADATGDDVVDEDLEGIVDAAPGAIELGPLTGLSDRIVDITQTGETMRQNGLREVDLVAEVSSRLVVNPASLKLRGDDVAALIARLESVL